MKHLAYAIALVPALIATPVLAQSTVTPPETRSAQPPAALPAPAVAEPAPPAAAPPPAAMPEPAAPPPAVAPAPAPPSASAAQPAPAEPAPRAEPPSLELFGTLAPTVVQGEPANPQLTNSFRRVGVYGEAGVAYRSKYFLDPFISVGYATLASGDTTLPDNEYFSGGTLHQHLGAWLLSPGVTSDLWRFRLRFGIGLAIVKQSFRFHGESNTGTQLPLVWEGGVGFNFYQVPRFRMDAEARFVEAKGADVSFWMIGVTGRGDIATF